MIEFNPKELTFENFDRFYIKSIIYQYLISKLSYLKGDLLDVGCGEMPYKEVILNSSSVDNYIGLDVYNALEYKKSLKLDYQWDGKKMPFSPESFHSAIATEVLEHCPDPVLTFSEIFRVLKPGSPFLLTVPFLWPTHESPNDFFRYTPYAIEKLLEEANFSSIEITCLGGWNSSLAQMVGLWIKRSGLSRRRQLVLFYLFKPFYNFLIKKDRPLSPKDDQNMFPSLGILAWKR